MNTTIISAFPGMGKTYFYNNANGITIADSDSSKYSWIYHEDGTKERNPEFPKNYIEHIKSLIGKVEYIFVSTHEEVRNALFDNKIPFIVVYPDTCLKSEFIERYKNRGSDEAFVKLMDEKFEEWVEGIYDWIKDKTGNYSDHKVMGIPTFKADYYLRDVINHKDFAIYKHLYRVNEIK